MKVQEINSLAQSSVKRAVPKKQVFQGNLEVQNSEISKIANTGISNYAKAGIRTPYTAISFSGKNTKKEQIAFIGAELPPYCKGGGVGTVMKDYCDFSPEGRMFIPYYNGSITYDPKTGKSIGEAVVHKVTIGDRQNVPIYTGADLTKNSIEEVVKKGDFFELEEIATSQMDMGMRTEQIGLYQVKGKNHYMIYTPKTASMPKPYADGVAYASDAVVKSKGWEAAPYAQFDKAVVELLPSLEEKGFSPETVICSDAQCAYIPEFMAKKNLEGNEFYQGMKPSYVGHNVGTGYIGYADGRQMLVNMGATKEQIQAIEKDSKFINAMLTGNTNDYFKEMMPDLFDKSSNSFSPTLIPLKYAQDGYLSHLDVVSDSYAREIANNPKSSPALYEHGWTELLQKERVGGILNPLNDPSLNPYEPKGLPKGFANPLVITKEGKAIAADATETIDGKKIYKALVADPKDPTKKIAQEITDIEKVFEPFEVFKKGSTLQEVLDTKRRNQANIFRRLSGNYSQPEVINGLCNNKPAYLIGGISEEIAQMAEQGKPINLVTSWGRADYQKGINITLEAFRRFAKTEEGKNAVLVAGAELTGQINGEIPTIKKAIQEIMEDPDLKGRFAFIDGYAPAKALSNAGNVALFTSRFEPCGLTDLEFMKYFGTPIVTNVDGFSQKNFDPRIPEEALKATSYKTTHSHTLTEEITGKIRNAFIESGSAEAKEAIKKEFPDVQESVFQKFAKTFEKLLNAETVKLQKQKFDNSQGITPDFKKLAMKNVLESDAYKTAEKQLYDSIMVDECYTALRAQATQSNETAETIFKNLSILDTSWTGNAKLNPKEISTHQLYQARHIDPTPQAPKSILLNISDSIMDKVENSPVKTKDIKNWWKKLSKNSKLIAGAGAAVIACAGIYAGYKNSKNKKLTQKTPAPTPSIASRAQVNNTTSYSIPTTTVQNTKTPSMTTAMSPSLNNFIKNTQK